MRARWLVLLSLCCCAAWADDYPSRPVTLIVPFAAGGPTDTIARTIAQTMSRKLHQDVVVENIGGAGGTVGAARVARAEPDGYTMLLYHIGMATTPALYRNLAFDPLRDFDAVGEVADVPMTLVARPDFPAKDFGQWLAYVKANSKNVVLAHAGAGSASHLCSLLLMNAIDVDLKTAAYKGTGPAMHDLLSGKVDAMCDQTTSTTSHIRGGKVQVYGVTTTQRVVSLPGLPSLHEAGLKNFHLAVWHGLYVPKNTPPPVIAKLTEALQTALQDPAVKARLNDLGTDPVPLSKATPQYGREHLQSETARWAPIIRNAGEYAD